MRLFQSLPEARIAKVKPELIARVARDAPLPQAPGAPPQKRPRGRVLPSLMLMRYATSASAPAARNTAAVFLDIFAEGGSQLGSDVAVPTSGASPARSPAGLSAAAK